MAMRTVARAMHFVYREAHEPGLTQAEMSRELRNAGENLAMLLSSRHQPIELFERTRQAEERRLHSRGDRGKGRA